LVAAPLPAVALEATLATASLSRGRRTRRVPVGTRRRTQSSVPHGRDRARRQLRHLAGHGSVERWRRVGSKRTRGHRGLVRDAPPAALRRCRVSLTVCLAPANTIGYPQGGGHLWVYLNWALALRAIGCRVIWLEGVDDAEGDASL